MISGEPLKKREVRDLRRIFPGTVSHTGTQKSLIFCAKKIQNVSAQERLKKDKFTRNQKQANSVHVLLSVRLACWLKILSFTSHGIHKFMVNIVDTHNIKITEEFDNISKIRTE